MNLILGILATYYLTLVVNRYDGPFSIFAIMRAKAPEFIADGLKCFTCLSLYMGIIISMIILGASDFKQFVIFTLALAGGAVLINAIREFDW